MINDKLIPEIYKRFDLYTNENGATSSFILSDSVLNYKKIEIYYSTNDDNQGIQAVYNNNNNFNTAISEIWTSSGTGDVLYIKTAQLVFSGTNVTYINGYEAVIGSGFSRRETSNIKIHNIIGYK